MGIGDSGLREELLKVFQEEETDLILDLAMYMLTEESAVFQHFPHWGRSHAIFSGSVRSDSYISRFQKESISLSKINQFKEFWAKRAIDDGKLYFCYDSTNTNSQAEGVFLVQKGHAKDDPPSLIGFLNRNCTVLSSIGFFPVSIIPCRKRFAFSSWS